MRRCEYTPTTTREIMPAAIAAQRAYLAASLFCNADSPSLPRFQLHASLASCVDHHASAIIEMLEADYR
jgi:hypothetical protein